MDFVNPNVPNDVKLQPGKKCFCMPTYFLNTFSNPKVPNDVRLPSRNYVCGPESNYLINGFVEPQGRQA